AIERRAAVAAEVAHQLAAAVGLGDEALRRALGEREAVARHERRDRAVRARGALAVDAVAGAQLVDRCADAVADGAAKTAAGMGHGSPPPLVSGYDTTMRWLCVLLVVMVETAWAQYPAKAVRMVV